MRDLLDGIFDDLLAVGILFPVDALHFILWQAFFILWDRHFVQTRTLPSGV
jgi:hypothetical protein